MTNLLKVEELCLFLVSIYFFSLTAFEWWWFPALLLLPDLGMLGYLAGSKVGAITYNLVHHRAIAVIIWVVGFIYHLPWVELIGVICFAHIAMDRVFGYGLKYNDDFHHTHLGWIKPPVKN